MLRSGFILFLYFYSLPLIYAYNVDWKHAIIYEGPSKTFGHSIIMSGGQNPWIQIGDPWGQTNKMLGQQGAIWRCPFKKLCTQLNINLLAHDKFSLDDPYWDLTFINQSSLLGGSMDILQQNSNAVHSLVCAPAMKFKSQSLLEPGGCFLQNENECPTCDPIVMKPFLDRKRIYKKEEIEGSMVSLYYFSRAQGGFSVHIIDDQDYPIKVLMGAPGMYYWNGGIALALGRKFLDKTSQRRKKRQSDTGFIIDEYRFLYQNWDYTASYFGYQVNSGRFFSNREIIYLASSPRYNYIGAVFLINEISKGEDVLKDEYIHSKLEGTEIGELFGASILVLRFKDPYYDELLIGSPLNSQDRGAVYYYVPEKDSIKMASKIVGSAPGGQFGQAMISLEGFSDSSQDVAIGAPSEDDGHGAVYIYNIGNSAFEKLQRIAASDIDITLQRFGYSFAQTDIDGNGYKDLGVGTQSGQAIILRSNPRISLFINLQSQKKSLEHTDTECTVQASIYYEGKFPPTKITIFIEMQIDKQLQRAFFNNRGVIEGNTNVTTNVYYNTLTKINFTVSIIGETINYFEPLRFYMHVVTVDKPAMQEKSIFWINKTRSDKFCSSCPVPTSADAELNIPFTLLCQNITCKADLNVGARFMNIPDDKRLIFGSQQDLLLNVDVNNTGEAAYLTELIIRYSEYVKLREYPAQCSTNDLQSNKLDSFSTTQLLCKIANPLKNNQMKILNISFDLTYLRNTIKSLTFDVKVTSKSDEINIFNNNITLILPVYFDIKFSLTGITVPSNMLFDQDSQTTFMASFLIQSEGASSFENASIKIKIPNEWIEPEKRKINFIRISQPKISLDDDLISKQSNCITKIEKIVDDKNEEEQHKIYTRSINGNTTSTVSAAPVALPVNRTMFMNCSTKEIACETITCSLGPFLARTLARVDVRIQLNIPLLKSAFKNRDIIQFMLEAWVDTPEKFNTLRPVGIKYVKISEILTRLPPKEYVETWIIALSAIGGLLIFFMLVMTLIKAGFFERKKKQELEKLKNQEAIEFKKRETLLAEDFQDMQDFSDQDQGLDLN